MQFSAAQIAALVNGKLEGNPEVVVNNVGKIEEAQSGQLTFLANPKYEEYLYSTRASIIIVNNSLELKHQLPSTLLRVEDAYSAFAALLTRYEEIASQQLTGIQQPSFIAKTAKLGENIFVG